MNIALSLFFLATTWGAFSAPLASNSSSQAPDSSSQAHLRASNASTLDTVPISNSSRFAHSNEIKSALTHALNASLWSSAHHFNGSWKTLTPDQVIPELLSLGNEFFKLSINYDPARSNHTRFMNADLLAFSQLSELNVSEMATRRTGFPLWSIYEGPSTAYIGGLLPEAIKLVHGDGIALPFWNIVPTMFTTSLIPAILPTDPFYFPALNTFQNLPLGGIVAWRSVILFPFLDITKGRYQVSYRTEDRNGGANADITTIIVPLFPGGQQIVYGQYEDSVALSCSPSYKLFQGTYTPEFQSMLSLNWILNVPDFEGTKGQFGTGIREGRSMLNAIRAARRLQAQFGISITQTSMWGFSGGSFPVQHAAEMLQDYAPELTITAVAVGGITPNKRALIHNLNGGPFAGFIVANLQGFIAQGGDEEAFYNRFIKDTARPRFDAIKKMCFSDVLLNYYGENIFSYTSLTEQQYFAHPVIDKAFKDIFIGTKPPKMPYMVYHSISDEVSPVINADNLVDSYCKGGTPLDYYRLPLTEHLLTDYAAATDAMLFLQRTFSGYVPARCNSWTEATQQSANTGPLSRDVLLDRTYGKYKGLVNL